MRFVVKEEYNGIMLREYLRRYCAVSRNTLTVLKARENGIMQNGISVTVRAIVHTGDIIDLRFEDTEEQTNPYVEPTGEMPPIVYEDEAILAVNKPAGMPTHTSFGHYDDTLSNAVCAYQKRNGKPFVFRATNRLDRDTSGIVLIAKNKYYSAILSKSLKEGNFKKEYLALVCGNIPDDGKIEGYIQREGESIIKRRLLSYPADGAEYSLTEFKTLVRAEKAALVLLKPITGRTHQLRVHLSSIGCPIIGDTLYGSGCEYIQRQALHAFKLSFPSPIDNNKQTLYVPLPDDIAYAADLYGIEIPKEFK